MGTKPAVGAIGQRGRYPKGLVNVALVLAVVTAIFHIYIGLIIYGVPLGIPLILIALVYLGGIGMITVNYRRALWLKAGLAWVVLVLILWALSAAVDSPNTRNVLAYLDKIVEVVLLGLLLWIWRSR